MPVPVWLVEPKNPLARIRPFEAAVPVMLYSMELFVPALTQVPPVVIERAAIRQLKKPVSTGVIEAAVRIVIESSLVDLSRSETIG